MRIERDEILSRGLIGHIVLNALASYPVIVDEIRDDGGADVLMTVNGQEVDIEAFADHWQGQVSEFIADKAESIIRDRFGSVSDLLSDLEERVGREIHCRLEAWETEDLDESSAKGEGGPIDFVQ